MKIIEPSHEILFIQPDPLQLIEQAGRTCYKSEALITANSAPRFAKMILERGHESVIEHASMSVRFVCDRGVSHELVRHRLAAYSQESTRYCDYSGEVTFIAPCFWRDPEIPRTGAHGSIGLYALWFEAMERAEDSYRTLIANGARPEQARSVLPNSLKTEVVMTANLREWRHVFRLRTSAKAHPQMRQLMRPLLAECRQRVPVIFDDVGVMVDQ